jgi:hypothetical protein
MDALLMPTSAGGIVNGGWDSEQLAATVLNSFGVWTYLARHRSGLVKKS